MPAYDIFGVNHLYKKNKNQLFITIKGALFRVINFFAFTSSAHKVHIK
jgi:hypothetical protein